MSTTDPDEQRPRSKFQRLLHWFVLVVGVLIVLLLVAGVGMALYHRYRVNHAIESALQNGPVPLFRFGPLDDETRKDDLFWLLSDSKRVIDRLLETMARDPNDVRRINAIKTLPTLLQNSGTHAMRRRCLDQMLDVALSGSAGPAVEHELLLVSANWIDNTGVDVSQRTRIQTRARGVPVALKPAWANVLAAIGGREEILLLFEFGETGNTELREAVWRSHHLQSLRWRGAIPFLERNLDDLTIAREVLQFSLLILTDEGRRLLVRFATQPENPLDLREFAINHLLENLAGTRLLQDAASDDQAYAVLAEVLGPDVHAQLATSIANHERYLGDDFWLEMIDTLDTSKAAQPMPGLPPATAKKIEEQMRQFMETSASDTGVFLKTLSGRDDLSTHAEWSHWFRATKPAPIRLPELAEAIQKHSDKMLTGTILRRFHPVKIGHIPEDCLPLYRRLAHEGTPNVRYWAAYALSLWSEDVSTVPELIELLRREKPADQNSSHSGIISMLRSRLAENYFWDADAWAKWWEAAKDEFERDDAFRR